MFEVIFLYYKVFVLAVLMFGVNHSSSYNVYYYVYPFTFFLYVFPLWLIDFKVHLLLHLQKNSSVNYW